MTGKFEETVFEIGKITKAQGIRGEFRVLPTTDDPSRFSLLVGENIFIDGTVHKLEKFRQQKSIVILKLEKIDDRNAAEALTGKKLTIPAEKALPLEDGEFYVRDLKGLCVETLDGERIGTVEDILHTNANDVYVIKPASPDSKAFMIPAVKDVVRDINIKDGKITVQLLDGMRELTT